MSYRLHCNVENPYLLARTMLKAKALAWSAKVFTVLAMSSTLTVELDAEVMRLAEQEAEAHKTTLVRVVERHLEVMAQNRRNSVAGKTPITDQLRGVISLPASDDYRELVAEELQKKYGG